MTYLYATIQYYMCACTGQVCIWPCSLIESIKLVYRTQAFGQERRLFKGIEPH